MEQTLNFITSLLKLPFVALFKTFFTILNFIPLGVYEIFGRRGADQSNRPDLREFHTKIKGKRRVHLGTFLIAWTRGNVIRVSINQEVKCWGVYSEDYQDIQTKWIW
ncbi:MAG: hypothetical protein CME62_14925 [Halobacteriovoraceae bacterium]|nr:hypothetical protein [Halobacteriovoraceae bacterium]|tara:strand:+ start:387 stop:707 length:321 start_codon:yes stop_codon:yes gene_type:complete